MIDLLILVWGYSCVIIPTTILLQFIMNIKEVKEYGRMPNQSKMKLCKICAETDIGTMALYPSNYDGSVSKLASSIAFLFNKYVINDTTQKK